MAFCAAIATAVILGACGSGLPGDAVVQVGNATITRAALIHWLGVANDASQVQSNTAAPVLPVPPDFTACIDAQQAATTTKSAGQTATFKASCESSYKTLLGEVLPYLITTYWLQAEAYDRGVHVTPAEISKAFATERKGATPPLATAAQLRSFLAASGQTANDLRWRTMVQLETNKIQLKVQKAHEKVTDAAIAAYYAKNKAQYSTPQTRDLHLVLASNAASAQKAHSLLAGGSNYSTVVATYSHDATSKAKGGQMLGVYSGELTPELNTAVFAAKTGELSAPIKTAFGYYIFTVDKITPGSVESLAKARAAIRTSLSSQQVTAAENALQAQVTKTWQSRTICRSGYVVTDCSNAPKTGATGATGG
jgi:foldase protein PrsA